MNRGNMNPFLHSMRLRGLKHGSEEEYDMFEDFAICRAKNRRMHGAADSRLQFEPTPPMATGEDGNTTAEITGREATKDTSSCAEDGKHCQEKDINANPLQTAAKNEVKEISNLVGRWPHVDDHVCTQAEKSTQPDPSTLSNSAVLQITIQVKSVQKKMKCGEPAVCNDPLQAGAETLE